MTYFRRAFSRAERVFEQRRTLPDPDDFHKGSGENLYLAVFQPPSPVAFTRPSGSVGSCSTLRASGFSDTSLQSAKLISINF